MPTGRPPSVLFISHTAQRTGAPIGLLAFMAWLRQNTPYRVGTLLGRGGPLEDEFRALGPVTILGDGLLHRTRLGRRLRRFLPMEVREEAPRVRRAFSQGPYDLIYSSTITNGPAVAALAGTGVPVVTHVHELAYWFWRTGEENIRRALDRTDAFIAVSRAVRDHLVEQHAVSPEKIQVIYEHIRALPSPLCPEEKSASRRALGLPEDAFVVGGCGTEFWRKGRDLIPTLLIALRRQGSPAVPIRFVWVGPSGSAEEEYALRYDLRQAGLEGMFHATGELAQPLPCYAAFDVFTLLSRDDPFPLVCLEVAALGVPILCFEGAGGMPEFVAGGGGGAVPYLDTEAMAEAAVGWQQNPVLRQEVGQAARAQACAGHSVEVCGPKILAVIEGQLDSGKTRVL